MSGALIAVDIGNSFLHAAAFRDHHGPVPQLQPIGQATYSITGEAELPLLSSGINDWIVSSVNRAGLQRLKTWLAAERPDARLRVLTRDDFALPVMLDAPERVGVDRLAAATTVNELRDPNRAAIIVDAGTATTVDLLDRDGRFRGGVILAGGGMMSSALADQTDALPHVPPPSEPTDILGTSTESAIASGLFWGALGAVRECVTQLRRQHDADAELFVTGGGASWLSELSGARHAGDLTLIGVAIAGRAALQEARK